MQPENILCNQQVGGPDRGERAGTKAWHSNECQDITAADIRTQLPHIFDILWLPHNLETPDGSALPCLHDGVSPGIKSGGERGIRTPDTRKGIHAFEADRNPHLKDSTSMA